MIIGTFFTLFVVPSVYMLVAGAHKRAEATEPVTAPADTVPAVS